MLLVGKLENHWNEVPFKVLWNKRHKRASVTGCATIRTKNILIWSLERLMFLGMFDLTSKHILICIIRHEIMLWPEIHLQLLLCMALMMSWWVWLLFHFTSCALLYNSVASSPSMDTNCLHYTRNIEIVLTVVTHVMLCSPHHFYTLYCL